MTRDAGSQVVTDDIRERFAERMSSEPGAPEPVADDDTGDVFGRLRERGTSFASTKGVTAVGAMASSSMSRLLRLSRLSMRWQLEQEAKRGPITKSVMERLSMKWHPIEMPGGPPMRAPKPSGGWVKVPISVAAAMAESRLPEGERQHYAAFKAEIPKLRAAARGERGRWTVDREIERRRAVFLSRFFPVPKPDEWHPGFWTEEQYDEIESRIRSALMTIETPADPKWWPDGWRDER